jgi:hypothetical protein
MLSTDDKGGEKFGENYSVCGCGEDGTSSYGAYKDREIDTLPQ